MTDLTNLIGSLSSCHLRYISLMYVYVLSFSKLASKAFLSCHPRRLYMGADSYSGAVGLRYQAAEGRDETAGRVD